MKKIFIFLFIFVLCSFTAVATNCTTCATCTSALNVAGADTVYLTSDISQSGTCINDPANIDNKIFDCQGHTITGSNSGYGLYINGENNVTLRNCGISNFVYNVYIYNSLNANISNCTFNNSKTDHVWLRNADNATVEDSRMYNSGHEGISMDFTDYALIENNTIIGAPQQAIEVQSSHYNTIINNYAHSCVEGIDFHWGEGASNYNTVSYNTIINASTGFSIWSTDEHEISLYNNFSHNKIYNLSHEDIMVYGCDPNDGYNSACLTGWKGRVIFMEGWVSTTSPIKDYCTNWFENNTYNDIPTYYANTTVSISDVTYSQVMLCGADDSVLDNITVMGYDYNGLDIWGSNNVTVKNSLVNDTFTGIMPFYSSNLNVTDTIIENSQLTDISLNNGFRGTLGHCDLSFTNVNGSNGKPLYFINDGSSLSNVEASSVVLCGSKGTVLDNITIEGTSNNKNAGILFYNASDVVIKNSVLTNGGFAISFFAMADDNTWASYGSSNITIDNVNVSNCSCHAFNTDYIGISNLFINNSNIYDNTRTGIKTYFIDGLTVENSNIFNNGYVGIYLAGVDNVYIDNVSVYDNKAIGIFEEWGPAYGGIATISNSRVYDNGFDFTNPLSCRDDYYLTATDYGNGFTTIDNYYGGTLDFINNVFYNNNDTEFRFIGGIPTINFENLTINNCSGTPIYAEDVSITFNGTSLIDNCEPIHNSNVTLVSEDDFIIRG